MEFINFWIYLSIYIGLIATTFFILSFLEDKKRKKLLFEDHELPSVSVIIPAYNEEKSMAKTLDSILFTKYPNFEVIIVDDGSKDNTLKIAKNYQSKKVKVFSKKNGGKASALNFGIAKAKGEILFTMDADTFVDEKSMIKMVRYFKNPEVMSVTPAMIIHKPKTILQRVQSIEYLSGLFLRKVFASLNAIYISPGAFSAYRKSFFEEYGGYDEENITEDLEMALRIQFNGYKTENCPDALAYTIPPSKFMPLLVQRKRWYYGLIKNCLKYRKLFSKKYGDLGVFILPIAWVSIFFSVLITSYLFIKTLLNVRKDLLFFNSANFDFIRILKLNLLVIERALFLLFSNPTVLFVLCFAILLRFYLYYASRKLGKPFKANINLPLFFIFFAFLFGFWWIVTIIYTIFNKKIKWR